MKLVALTGSIGMGKSTTLEFFEKKGVPVFDSDKAVHALYEKGAEGALYIEAHFPQAISAGRVERAQLSRIVMENPDALGKIEKALHPMVQKMQTDFIAAHSKSPVIVMDIPLLFETGKADKFDKVIVVTAPEEVQKKRVLERPGMTLEKFEKIKSLQVPDFEKRAKADFIIETHKGFDHAEKRVDEILKEIMS